MSAVTEYRCRNCGQHWLCPPLGTWCQKCGQDMKVFVEPVVNVTYKETRLPTRFKPDALKNAELEQASMRRQFESREGAVTEAIRLERERITSKLNLLISTYDLDEENRVAVEALQEARDKIVNPK